MLTYTGDGRTLSMSYDALRRLSSVTGGVYERKYLYRDIGSGKTTSQVSSLTYKNPAGAAVYSYSYTYDVLGNIASYTDASGTQVYEYDAQSQLKKVTNTSGNVLYQYTYDNAGNILTANGKTYTYGNAVWKDLLTKYDGQSIAYEGQTISGNTVTGTIKSGNPISYYNGTRWEFDWKEGRNLVSADSNVYSIDYTYDLNGLRTSKKVGNVTHNYYYAGGKLLRETYGSNTLDFFYDQSGYPYALKYNGTLYYYITNLQGDVLHLTNANGTVVVSYTYDPYGKPLAPTGTMATTLGAVNPLRYRGYYYDTETGFYYLQSRYYDPTICRFINADSYAATGQELLGNNMFVYCLNNPINRCDSSGSISVAVIKVIAMAIVGGIVNAVCSFATGGSFEDIVEAFIIGLVEGALSELTSWGMYVVIIGNAIDTAVECYNSGAGVGSSLLAGVLALLTALPFIPECDLLTDILVDLTFGLGFSLISSSITAGIESNASAKEEHGSTAHLSNEITTKTDSVVQFKANDYANTRLPTENTWKPSYNGLGWVYYEKLPSYDCRVPMTPHAERLS